MSEPFIIYALPRSRTAWLSKFLSYKDWNCYHEQAVYMRDIGDIEALFDCPNTGTAETAAIAARHLIRYLVPNIKEVAVIRPVDEVVDGIMNMDVGGIATYDREKLQKIMAYEHQLLSRVAKEPNVLAVNFEDLECEDTCAEIFEHCLPYQFDKAWWESLRERNIQRDMKALLSYYYKNVDAVNAFKKHAKSELRKLCRMGVIWKELRV